MRRVLWLLTAVVLLVVALSVYVVVDQDGRLPIQIPVGKACRAQTEAGSVHLYPEQMANASTIAAVGLAKGLPDRAIVIALATAMQESELINVNHGDRDSLGLFQQRPSQGWGTPEQVSDPRYATSAFYRQLVLTPGWQEMRVTEAAQAVQRSAFPEAYEKWADDAQVLGDALVGVHSAAITCEKVGEPTVRGPAATDILAADLWGDWGRSATTEASDAGATITVQADHDRVGWQLAHWLVARSIGQNVSRVRFGQHEWTLESGAWNRVEGADAASVVIADVYPA
jgi:hypothetical protein